MGTSWLALLRRWLRYPETLKLAIHGTLTAIMAWLAVALLLPGDILASPAFREFAALGSEEEWACLFFLAALVGMVGFVSRPRWLRLGAVCGLSMSHMSVAYCFYLGSVSEAQYIVTAGTGTYGLVALMGWILWWVRLFENPPAGRR